MKLTIMAPLALGIGLILAGCSNPPQQQICTLIGCESGLTLAFEGAAPESYRFTLTAAEGETRQGECPATDAQDTLCFEDKVLLSRFTPDQVELSLSVGEQSLKQTFQPQYTTSRPNGPNCEPECKQATITVDLSQASTASN